MTRTINEILNSNLFTRSLKRVGLIKDVDSALKKKHEDARITSVQKISRLEAERKSTQSELSKATQRVTRLEAERKTIVSELHTLRPLHDAVTMLSSGPDLVRSCIDYVDKLMTHKRGGLAYSFAYAIRDQLSEERGNLCLLAIANRRKLSKFALQLSNQLDVEKLAKYGLPGACFGLGNGGSADKQKLIAVLGHFAKSEGFGRPWPEFELAMRTALALKQLQLYSDLRKIAGRVNVLEAAPDYRIKEFDAAFARFARSEMPITKSRPSQELEFGLLSYKNIDYSSFNVGDYIQSLAVNNFLASLEYEAGISGDAAEIIYYLSGQQAIDGTPEKIERPVRFTEIQRDWMSLAADEDRDVWHISYGWHMHRQGLSRYDFPPPENLRPILISVHIARPDMLTEEVVDYYKKYGPVGCRDWNTVRLLKSHGVSVFFSGCATTMLGHYYKANSEGAAKRVYADYLATKKNAKQLDGRLPIDHTRYELIYQNYVDNIRAAHELLKFYEQGCDVATPLLHAYLPNRAIGNAVTFTHGKLADPRFEGLIGISDHEIASMADGIRSKLHHMMKVIASGVAVEEVYCQWRELCADDVRRAEDYLDYDRHRKAYDAYKDLPLDIQIEPVAFRAGHKVRRTGSLSRNRKEDDVHLAFCFDKAFLHYTKVTILNACQKTSGSIIIHAFGRDIAEEDIATLSRLIPSVTLYFYDMSAVDYGSVNLLSHISISTMDRLLIPAVVADAEKVLYLDADLYIRGDLRELFDVPLNGNAIAARSSIHDEWKDGYNLILNIANRFAPDKAAKFRSEFYAGGDIHFNAYNAGIMVMDVARLRAARFSNMMIAMVREYGFHDQIAVNVFTRGARTELDEKWNHFPSQEMINDPAIVHYIGTAKPWHDLYQRYTSDWQEVERKMRELDEGDVSAQPISAVG
jgi:lipopolysaccharide biosynthesis glycosyltransferase